MVFQPVELDSSKACRFFSDLFRDYPDKYLDLGHEITFHEGVDDSGNFFYRVGLLPVDTLIQGCNRYAHDVTPERIRALGGLTVLAGTRGCHYELNGSMQEPWVGFVTPEFSGMVSSVDTSGTINPHFTRALAGITFADRADQEKFVRSLWELIAPGIIFTPINRELKKEPQIRWQGRWLHLTVSHSQDEEWGKNINIPDYEMTWGLEVEFNAGRIDRMRATFQNDRHPKRGA